MGYIVSVKELNIHNFLSDHFVSHSLIRVWRSKAGGKIQSLSPYVSILSQSRFPIWCSFSLPPWPSLWDCMCHVAFSSLPPLSHGLPNRQPKCFPSGLVWSRLVWKAGWGSWHVIRSPADRGDSSLTPRPWAVGLPLPCAELCPCARNEENFFSPDNSSCPHELYVNLDVLESFKTKLF